MVALAVAPITRRRGVLIEMCEQRALVHRSGWKLVATRLSDASQRRFGCRAELLAFPPPLHTAARSAPAGAPPALPTHVATRVCDVPRTLPTKGVVGAHNSAWVQLQHECEPEEAAAAAAAHPTLRPLRDIRWAKWWLPGVPTMDTFGNSSLLDAEQHYAPSDPLELSNRRGEPACAREAFCLQIALRREVARAVSRQHGARRGEHAARMLLATVDGRAVGGVAAMESHSLDAAAHALGCDQELWVGDGWCTPAAGG